MAFASTPQHSQLPAQLLPLSSITSTVVQQSGVPSKTVAISSPPVTGTVAIALALAGTVFPSASAVQVGLSTSSSTAPVSWSSATVSGTGWTASLTPPSAGTYYIWAELTGSPSVQAVSAAVTISLAGAVTFTAPPTIGVAGAALSLAGTVSPSGTALQVGLSSSATVAPSSWTNAAVSGTGWTALLTPGAAGTYFIWVEQNATPSVLAVSAAVIVASSGGSNLAYSLISGSGNSSLTSATLVTSTTGSSPAVDWNSAIARGATDVAPNLNINAMGSIAAVKFWFDTTNTSVTVPAQYANGLLNSSSELIAFYPYAAGYGVPTTVPPAPSAAGTYYGKYAFYNSSSTLLGVFTTSAITVT